MRDPVALPDLTDLASRLGLALGRGGFGPCPSCGADKRGGGDRRSPIRIYGQRWHCHAVGCGAGGDALALLAWVRCGECPPKGDPRWRSLLDEIRGGDAVPMSRRALVPVPKPVAVVERPDPAEVAALWAACKPFEDRDIAARFLRLRRGLNVDVMTDLDLARVLPEAGFPWPRWVSSLGMDRAAWRAVYQIAVPAFNARGELASLRYRAVTHYPPDQSNIPPPGCWHVEREGRSPDLMTRVHGEDRKLEKSLASRGSAAGLVLADPIGLALLRGAREDEGMRWSGLVVFAEGEPDMWAYATKAGRCKNGETYAVFGIEAGSWTAEHAERIPDGARVLLETHDDAAGDRYADQIAATLAGRCTIKRQRKQHAKKP